MSTTEAEHRERLDKLLDDFDSAMLVTHDARGELRARPMSLADRSGVEELWFVTGKGSGKQYEIEKDARVAVIVQGPRQFASITGRAELIVDRARFKSLWREEWRPWFPGGPDDERGLLVRVVPQSAEYWDLKGTSGLRYLTAALRAMVKGEAASDAADQPFHGRTAAAPSREL